MAWSGKCKSGESWPCKHGCGEGVRNVQLLPLKIFILYIFATPVVVWVAGFLPQGKDRARSRGMQ